MESPSLRKRPKGKGGSSSSGSGGNAAGPNRFLLYLLAFAVLVFFLTTCLLASNLAAHMAEEEKNAHGGPSSGHEHEVNPRRAVAARIDFLELELADQRREETMERQQRQRAEQKMQQPAEQEEHERPQPPPQTSKKPDNEVATASDAAIFPSNHGTGPHLDPPTPYLPPHAAVPDKARLISDVLSGQKPTVAGIHAILQNFLLALHKSNRNFAAVGKTENDREALRDRVIAAYMKLAKEYLLPLDEAYRGRPVFPVREDGSIFMSLASFRDHLLGATLKEAFRKAAHPDKIFVGAVVQNCFGDEYTCKTGAQVVGKDKNGRDMTKVSDAPPDKNGIAEFCQDPEFEKYCRAGQVRALYVNETESLGPAVARYYASKLWGGETYYVQTDAHLRFAPKWDQRYIDEVKAATAYPKAVLSAYPPGFSEGDPDYVGGSQGSRLCTCEFSHSDVEEHIIRINTGPHCANDDVPGPTQVAFIAAGFFFAHASFLTDVPFDPILPWCFMGEEIALSIRAWTSGWDIYAPRENLIAHQYRPGRMGLPKFWGSVGRLFGRPGPGFNTKLQKKLIMRIKHMVGYPEVSRQAVIDDGAEIVLTELEHYGLGTVRKRDEYLAHTSIDFDRKQCGHMHWCNKCELA